MIIEFFGMPGTGKTTTAKHIAETLGFEIITIDNNIELLVRNVIFIATHPIKTSTLFVWLILNSNHISFWYKFTNLFLHPNAKYQKASTRAKALIDQGYYQSAISLFDKKQSKETIQKLMKTVFQPDFLLVFVAPNTTRQQRLEHRHYIVRERDGEQVFLERLVIMDHHFQLCIETVQNRATPHTIINSDTSIERVYTIATEAIVSACQ